MRAVLLTQVAICTDRWDLETDRSDFSRSQRTTDAGIMFAALVKTVQGRCATCLDLMASPDSDLDHFCCSDKSTHDRASSNGQLLRTDPFGSASKMGEFLRLRGVHSRAGICHPIA